MNFITEMLDLFYAIKHLYKKIGGGRLASLEEQTDKNGLVSYVIQKP